MCPQPGSTRLFSVSVPVGPAPSRHTRDSASRRCPWGPHMRSWRSYLVEVPPAAAAAGAGTASVVSISNGVQDLGRRVGEVAHAVGGRGAARAREGPGAPVESAVDVPGGRLRRGLLGDMPLRIEKVTGKQTQLKLSAPSHRESHPQHTFFSASKLWNPRLYTHDAGPCLLRCWLSACARCAASARSSPAPFPAPCACARTPCRVTWQSRPGSATSA